MKLCFWVSKLTDEVCVQMKTLNLLPFFLLMQYAQVRRFTSHNYVTKKGNIAKENLIRNFFSLIEKKHRNKG